MDSDQTLNARMYNRLSWKHIFNQLRERKKEIVCHINVIELKKKILNKKTASNSIQVYLVYH
jgi:hypothetical protein